MIKKLLIIKNIILLNNFIFKNKFKGVLFNMNMRVAVCFFGEMRGTPEIWNNIYKNIVLPYNADVFMHHVYYDNSMPSTLYGQHEDFNWYYEKKGINLKPPTELFEIFKPKKVLLEARPTYDINIFNKIKETTKEPTTTPLQYHAIRNQAESRKKTIQLKIDYEKEHHFKYDVVINTRLDLRIFGPLQLHMSRHVKTQYCGGIYKIFEQLIYGPSDVMDSMCDFYENVIDLYMKLCGPETYMMMNEVFMAHFFIHKGIHVENVWLPLDYSPHMNGLQRSDKSFFVA